MKHFVTILITLLLAVQLEAQDEKTHENFTITVSIEGGGSRLGVSRIFQENILAGYDEWGRTIGLAAEIRTKRVGLEMNYSSTHFKADLPFWLLNDNRIPESADDLYLNHFGTNLNMYFQLPASLEIGMGIGYRIGMGRQIEYTYDLLEKGLFNPTFTYEIGANVKLAYQFASIADLYVKADIFAGKMNIGSDAFAPSIHPLRMGTYHEEISRSNFVLGLRFRFE